MAETPEQLDPSGSGGGGTVEDEYVRDASEFPPPLLEERDPHGAARGRRHTLNQSDQQLPLLQEAGVLLGLLSLHRPKWIFSCTKADEAPCLHLPTPPKHTVDSWIATLTWNSG